MFSTSILFDMCMLYPSQHKRVEGLPLIKWYSRHGKLPMHCVCFLVTCVHRLHFHRALIIERTSEYVLFNILGMRLVQPSTSRVWWFLLWFQSVVDAIPLGTADKSRVSGDVFSVHVLFERLYEKFLVKWLRNFDRNFRSAWKVTRKQTSKKLATESEKN